MRFITMRTGIWTGMTLALCVLFACDSERTLVEAFLRNGAETKLFTYSYRGSSSLGHTVAISGNRALVGPFVYRSDGSMWIKEAGLSPSQPRFVSQRSSIALDGIRAVVGGGGFVDVYRFNGAQWQEETRLTSGQGATTSWFGHAVSISSRVIAVADYGGSAVYIFRFDGSNWLEEARLTASLEEDAGGFGYAVSVSGNLAIIGASEETRKGNEYEYTGVAYVYRFTGSQWREEGLLRASAAESNSSFGRAVAISGNVAIVGAPYDSSTGVENSGSAYVFRNSGGNWSEEAKLAPANTDQSYFGWSVAVENNVAIIGAPFVEVTRSGYSDADITPGAAYVYRYEGGIWRERHRLAASDGAAGNRFGAAVAMSGRSAIVGAPAPYFYGRNEGGAAYVYTLD